jgi:hypothetical protein
MDPHMKIELARTLDGLERMIDGVVERSAAWGIPDPYAATDSHGRPLLADLVVAKANVLVLLASDPTPDADAAAAGDPDRP